MIFVNFKTYRQGTGEAALKLARICLEAERNTGIKIIPIVQAVDIFRLFSLGLNVWAQHVDDIDFGPNTGQVLPQAVRLAGAKGTLLNHSENKLPVEVIGTTIEKFKVQSSKFKVLVCAESIAEGKEIAEFKPDLIAYEPPELIGGNVSVSSAQPRVVRDFVKEIQEIPILVGAGIQTAQAVKIAIKLGAVGVLVSSGVVLAPAPKKQLLDLAVGFK